MSSGVTLTLWSKAASLVLVDHPSSNGVTIKVPSGVDFFYIDQRRTPPLPIGLVKTESELLDQ